MERSYGFPSNLNLVEKGLRYLKIWVQLQSHRFAIGSLVLSEPIAITCCVNFGARFIKFLAIVSLALNNPIAVTCCVNFGVRFTPHCPKLNVNEEKPSKFQFNFPTLLGPCPMLKRSSKFFFVFTLIR